jgi:hypothetical protein
MSDPDCCVNFFLRLSAELLTFFSFSCLAARNRETHYLLSGSADGAIMVWKIGSGKGEVSLCCFQLIVNLQLHNLLCNIYS